MKILVWILAIVSILAGLFLSFFSYVSQGLGLVYTGFGEAVSMMGMLTVVVCIVCGVLGIIRLRKGNGKKALVCTLVGLGYCVAIVAGMIIDEVVYTKRLEAGIAERNKQMYGENWDAAPAIEGIPEQYQHILNQFYAVVRDRWPGDQLMDLGAVSMAEYYGDSSLDNIGFALVDLNGDNVEELVIGAVAQAEQQGNAIFCIFANPETPIYAINSAEGWVYYLHSGETDGTYEAEIIGYDGVCVIEAAQSENTFTYYLREGAIDADGRITLAMTPFSQYK